MKKLLTIFFITIVSSCCMAQDSLTIYLTYGTLLNDYSEKTFKSEERVWEIKDGQIIYFIDAHNKRYSDTLKISQGNYDTITECLKKNNLLKSIDLNLENSNSYENEYKEYIKGMIIFNGNEYKFNISTNSYSMGNKNSVLKAFKELEQLFYNVIE